jgi:hypothetical protein
MQHLYKVLLSVILLVSSTIPVLAQNQRINHPHHPHKPHHPHHPPSASYAVFLTGPVRGREGVTDAGFTIASYSDTGTDTLTAYYTISGTAIAGEDYEPLTGTALIYGSDSSFVPIHLIDDYNIEGDETLIITLDNVISSDPQSQIDIQTDTLTLAITDNDWDPAAYKVVVTGGSSGAEGGPDGTITVSLEGNKVAPENIVAIFEYDQYHDSAQPGSDYNFQMSVIIPAGQHSATGIISIVDDNIPESTKSANFSLIQVYGLDTYSPYPFDYGAGITMTITDNDGGITLRSVNGAEGGVNGAFIFSWPPGTSYYEDVNILFTLSGSASYGDDYYSEPQQVTIPWGQNEVVVPIEIFDDAAVEGFETVVLNVSDVYSDPGYTYFPVQVVNNVVTITDNDTLQIARIASANATNSTPVISIYPNPVATDLYVAIDNPAPGARMVINTSAGQVLIRKNIISSKENISLTTLAPGIYFVTINNGGKITTCKIVKQ